MMFISLPRHALLFMALLAASALGMAYIAQYGYGLQPCELCHIQRYVYGGIIGLGLVGAFLTTKSPKAGPVFLAVAALAALAEAAAAFYHSGVERHWWKSFLEGCSVPEMKGNITDVLAQIAATPAVRCDEIPWTDPVIGLSMANYNVMYALMLVMIALSALNRALSRRAS